jgi:hypothetical protein
MPPSFQRELLFLYLHGTTVRLTVAVLLARLGSGVSASIIAKRPAPSSAGQQPRSVHTICVALLPSFFLCGFHVAHLLTLRKHVFERAGDQLNVIDLRALFSTTETSMICAKVTE